MSEPFRLRYVNQIVGAVLLIALLLLLALGLYVIRGRYVFARSVDYQVAIPQEMIRGLRRGSDVVILGDVVGRVDRIAYAPDGRSILLDLKIKEPFRDQILHVSQIQVRRKFGVGEPYLDLTSPDEAVNLEYQRENALPAEITLLVKRAPSVPLTANQMLSFSDQEDTRITGVADQAGATMRDFQSLTNQSSEGFEKTVLPSFEQVTGAAKSVRKTSDEFRPAVAESLQNMNDFIAHLEDEIDSLSVKMNDVDDEDARPALQELQSTLENVNGLIDEIGPKASGTLEEWDVLAQSLNHTLQGVDKIVKILNDDLQYFPGTVPQIRKVVPDADEVITGVHGSRFFGGIIKRGNNPARNGGGGRNRGSCNCNQCQANRRAPCSRRGRK